MKRRGLLAFLAVVLPLLFTAALLAQTTPWQVSISVDPAVLDLTQGQREVTVTVAISRTDSVVENALVICSVQPGAVVSMSEGLYRLGASGVVWVGDVTTATQAFTLTARPSGLFQMDVPCGVIADGALQHTMTGTLAVTPFRLYLPLVLNNYAAPVETQVMEIANPGGGFLASFSHTSYAEALAGTGAPLVYAEENWNGGWFQSIRWNWPSNTFYAVMRSYLEFDTTALPVGSVISDVSLSLVVKNSDIGAIGDFSAQRGTWSSLTNTLAVWNAWEPETLAYQTAVVSGTMVNLTLPVTSVVAGGVTKIALRLQPEEVPPEPRVMAYANVFPRPSATLRVTYLPKQAGP